MRWFWIDRFTEFVSGSHAVAVKNVSLAEEQLQDYFPGCPVMPHSLIVEGIAQTGGLLVGEHGEFRERVVLAKLGRATFHDVSMPGDSLTYSTRIEDIRADGAIVSATCRAGDQLRAEVELVFAHLGSRFSGPLFYPAEFLNMLRIFGLYDVGRTREGQPLQVPSALLEAEAIWERWPDRVADG